MEYISSDTNVWLDFVAIEKLSLPFQLPYIYLMNDETVEDELLSPPGLSDELLQLGLQKTELTEEEFYLAEALTAKYTKPSVYDCIALAIAKVRGLTLLTGDGPLRKAAAHGGQRVKQHQKSHHQSQNVDDQRKVIIRVSHGRADQGKMGQP